MVLKSKLPAGWVPPYEQELEAEQHAVEKAADLFVQQYEPAMKKLAEHDAQNADSSHSEPLSEPLPPKDAQTPTRSLQERFENAEMILMRDRMKWTPAQEEHFLMKWQELCDLYQEGFPGTEWPCLRYNKDGFLEVERRLMSFWKVLS